MSLADGKGNSAVKGFAGLLLVPRWIFSCRGRLGLLLGG